jgi:PhoPQ-activated pathogenicity-related protein
MRSQPFQVNRMVGVFYLIIWAWLILTGQIFAQQTSLDRYIAMPDPVYAWKLVSTIDGQRCQGFVLELTSQRWRSEAEVDRPVMR